MARVLAFRVASNGRLSIEREMFGPTCGEYRGRTRVVDPCCDCSFGIRVFGIRAMVPTNSLKTLCKCQPRIRSCVTYTRFSARLDLPTCERRKGTMCIRGNVVRTMIRRYTVQRGKPLPVCGTRRSTPSKCTHLQLYPHHVSGRKKVCTSDTRDTPDAVGSEAPHVQ